jgi:hypothetical protein
VYSSGFFERYFKEHTLEVGQVEGRGGAGHGSQARGRPGAGPAASLAAPLCAGAQGLPGPPTARRPPTQPHPQEYQECVATTDLHRHTNPGGDGLLSYCHWRFNLTMTFPGDMPDSTGARYYTFGQ